MDYEKFAEHFFFIRYFGCPQSAIDWNSDRKPLKLVHITCITMKSVTSDVKYSRSYIDANYTVSAWRHLSVYLNRVLTALWIKIHWFSVWNHFCIFHGSWRSPWRLCGALSPLNGLGREMHCPCCCAAAFKLKLYTLRGQGGVEVKKIYFSHFNIF